MEEIITPNEVAALLRIHVKTVYRLAEEGLIPGKRIGRSWRFRKSSVLELISCDESVLNGKPDPVGESLEEKGDGKKGEPAGG